MNNDTPTPETDAQAADLLDNDTCSVQFADFARKLERERDEAIKERDAFESEIDDCENGACRNHECRDERDALRAELAQEKARLDWLEKLDCHSPDWDALRDTTKLRAVIDAAMKIE